MRILRFNPTLVRFCRVVRAEDAYYFRKFQSHLGSILPCCKLRSIRAGAAKVSIPPWFDFARCPSCPCAPTETVSIPPWFDFAPAGTVPAPCGLAVSIPPWFDFAPVPVPNQHRHEGGFNPTLVRFCPNWYHENRGVLTGFNPTLVRFCLKCSTTQHVLP